MTYEINRPSLPLAAGVAAGASAVAALSAALVSRRAKRGANQSASATATVPVRDGTGGCDPDLGLYVDAPLYIPGIDGTHQGIAVAMLRERFSDEEKPQVDPITGEYGEIMHSLVEVGLNLALNLAEHEFDDEHECDDPECEGGSVEPELLALVAGRRMTEFAVSWTKHSRNHAAECPECDEAGENAPGMMRARFCRDLADDLLTNINDLDTHIQGIPVAAAFDVLVSMIEVGEQCFDTSPNKQIEELGNGLLLSLQYEHEDNNGH